MLPSVAIAMANAGDVSPIAKTPTNTASDEPGNKVADKKAAANNAPKALLINERHRVLQHQSPSIEVSFVPAMC